jgi:hypothetical protein
MSPSFTPLESVRLVESYVLWLAQLGTVVSQDLSVDACHCPRLILRGGSLHSAPSRSLSTMTTDSQRGLLITEVPSLAEKQPPHAEHRTGNY